MRNLMEPDFKALEKNIIDIIKEEQIKLGYQRETIRLYYPMDSINHILGNDYSFTELPAVLDQFSTFVSARLGKVAHSNENMRFCFVIPPNGVTYVHEKVEDNPFLIEFIEKIKNHNCTLEEILKVFHHYSKHVICKEMNNGEFDYSIYFSDEYPDSYIYCLKFENNHVIYHRFTKADYKDLDL